MAVEHVKATTMELVRWRQRIRELEALIQDAAEEEARLLEELGTIDAQMAYYGSLTGDMKKDLQPPSLTSLIRSLRW